MQILPLIRERFAQALVGWVDQPTQHAQRVTLARDARHGDYQANIAMPLQKELGQKPLEIAQEIIERLQIEDICETPKIAGPGFINLKLRDDFLARQLSVTAADARQGVTEDSAIQDGERGTQAAQRTFVIDYSAPNVAKPMHVGHIRSTVIGDALTRILRFLGHRVISDNHLGDWGTQFGMIIYGYKHFVERDAFAAEPVRELSRLYRLVQTVIGYQTALKKLSQASLHAELAAEKLGVCRSDPARKNEIKAAEKELKSSEDTLQGLQQKVAAVEESPQLLAIANEHTELETRAQKETVKLHEGDAENLELWETFVPISVAEIESVYGRLDVHFDHTYGESFYHSMLDGVVKRLVDSGMAVVSDGATCIFLDGFDAPMIIRKRDGAFLYATTDLATIDYRMETFQPDAILYVVDHRQSEHFAKLFAAARAIGYTHVELKHISFGTVLGSDGKPFKTRSGEVIGLDYLLDEAVERAYQAVCNPDRLQKAGIDMSEEELRHVANTVGLGAIKYADLTHNRTSDYEFNTEKMVQLEGNTSTYIQYMVARAGSILRRSGETIDATSVAEISLSLGEPAERQLALQLLQFEDTLRQSVEEYYPSVLAAYLFGVAKQFAAFFDQCPVLTAESESLKRSRLVLCYATAQILGRGLGLLGIGVVERM